MCVAVSGLAITVDSLVEPSLLTNSHVQDCHGLSQDVPCICVHYTLFPNHTLILTYCPTIILGIPMAILDTCVVSAVASTMLKFT